jgi:hypothetical protein
MSRRWSWVVAWMLAGACASGNLEENVAGEAAALSWPGASVDTLVTNKRTRADITNFGCWDVPNGTPRWLNQFPCHARSHQLFRFEWTGSAFRVKLKQDTGLCLDVPGFNYAAGQRIQMYPCNGGPNQSWIVHRANPSDAYATIRPQPASNLCLQVRNQDPVNSSAIDLAACNAAEDRQKLRFHSWVDSDGGSCSGSIHFSPPFRAIAPGEAKAFPVAPSWPTFEATCATGGNNGISCDEDDTDLFVVDRVAQSSGYTVRCFKTDPDPVVEPPLGCPAGYECCSGDPVNECARGDCARDCGNPN